MGQIKPKPRFTIHSEEIWVPLKRTKIMAGEGNMLTISEHMNQELKLATTEKA